MSEPSLIEVTVHCPREVTARPSTCATGQPIQILWEPQTTSQHHTKGFKFLTRFFNVLLSRAIVPSGGDRKWHYVGCKWHPAEETVIHASPANLYAKESFIWWEMGDEDSHWVGAEVNCAIALRWDYARLAYGCARQAIEPPPPAVPKRLRLNRRKPNVGANDQLTNQARWRHRKEGGKDCGPSFSFRVISSFPRILSALWSNSINCLFRSEDHRAHVRKARIPCEDDSNRTSIFWYICTPNSTFVEYGTEGPSRKKGVYETRYLEHCSYGGRWMEPCEGSAPGRRFIEKLSNVKPQTQCAYV